MFDISWPIWPIICQDVLDFEPLWSILNPFQASQSFRCAPFWPLGVLASLPPAPLQSWPLASRPRPQCADVFNELRAFMSQICACPIIWLQPSVGGLCFCFWPKPWSYPVLPTPALCSLHSTWDIFGRPVFPALPGSQNPPAWQISPKLPWKETQNGKLLKQNSKVGNWPWQAP